MGDKDEDGVAEGGREGKKEVARVCELSGSVKQLFHLIL